MPRPRKADSEKRTERITIYLTPGERRTLEALADGGDMAKTAVKALQHYRAALADPPAALKQAKLDSETEKVNSYVCNNGHFFTVEIVWPAPPRHCPACGTGEIKAGWAGTVRKGFE